MKRRHIESQRVAFSSWMTAPVSTTVYFITTLKSLNYHDKTITFSLKQNIIENNNFKSHLSGYLFLVALRWNRTPK